MQKIGLVKLRSSMSASDRSLKEECNAFLSSLSPKGEFLFTSPGQGYPTVFLVLTGGSETYFKECHKEHKPPYFIMPTGERNSLAASLEIASYLKREGLPFCLLYGKSQTKALSEAVSVYRVYNALSGARLGVIGGSSSWLIASNVDRRKLKDRFGVSLVNIPMRDLLSAYDRHYMPDADLLSAFEKKTRRKDELRDALYVYGALKNLKETKRLDAITMKCFDLISSRQVSACLAFALLNGEGIVAGCEGDIPSAISMMIMNSLSEEGAFMANPAYMDENGNEAIYAHCTVPVSMLSSYSLATHFESGLSFALRGQLKKLPVTAIKVSPDLDDIRAIEGRITDNPVKARLCRTQIKVKFDEPIAPLIHDPYGNHLIFGYGRHKAEIEALKALFCPKGQ